jgi:hypothetical protein
VAGLLRVLGVALVIALAPLAARAQDSDADTSGNVIAGPLGVTPRVTWQTELDDNFYRTNVPISEVISTFGASTDARGRIRRIGLSVSGRADWVHFSKLVTERGANADAGLRLDFLFHRVVPYVTTSYRNTRERLNAEIDTRPRMQQTMFGAGSVVRLGGKTSLDFSATRARIAYGRSYEADGVILEDALNRVSDYATLKLLRHVTPLTHFHVTGEMFRHDFDMSLPRNSDNLRLMGGFESTGRVTGHARGGIRILRRRDQSVPESRGVYLSVGTSATVRDRVQIGVNAERDVAPSYRAGATYYDFYSYGGTITCAVVRSLRVSTAVNQRVAQYPTDSSNLDLPFNYLGTDRETRYGSAIRYQIGQSLAIDVAGTFITRSSTLASRQFDGRSIKVGVSHAF